MSPEHASPPSRAFARARTDPRIALLLNALPGLLAGTQVAGLIFFLNPDLSFGAGALLRGMLVFGGGFGLASAAILSPFTWRRPGRAWRLLPWSVSIALALAAVLDWTHASRFAYFVPPGINVRLIKAAGLLTVTALVCFYTALVHSLQRRPYSRRTAAFLVFLALLSVYLIVERREAFRPPAQSPPLPSAVATESRPALLVVGLEGATLDAILPLARQGHLPFFAQLIERGSYARLQSLTPTSPPALWTSLATGNLPFKHGILGERIHTAGFLSPGGDLRLLPRWLGFSVWGTPGMGSRPADAAVKKSLAMWEILSRVGLKVGVVGWPACHPSTADLDFAFSDRYFQGDYLAAVARPPELVERGLLFRFGVDELDPALVARFGAEVPHALLRAFADDLWRESLTGFLMEWKRDVGAVFLLLPGLGEVSKRYYGSYSVVHFDGDQTALHQQASQYVSTYYRHLDDFLASVSARFPGPRLLAVVSVHGAEAPGAVRRIWGRLARKPLRGDFGGAPDGVLFLAGEGIQAGTFLDEAHLIDVMPTLLYGSRFPIARDLDGRVLTSAFEGGFLANHPLTFVPSYETLARE